MGAWSIKWVAFVILSQGNNEVNIRETQTYIAFVEVPSGSVKREISPKREGVLFPTTPKKFTVGFAVNLMLVLIPV